MMKACKKHKEYNKYLNGWIEDLNYSSNVKYEPIKDDSLPFWERLFM
tara:strand:+ start:75 stop:215 length:141 start_codon:yes stop_codon:yes gene_type:complete